MRLLLALGFLMLSAASEPAPVGGGTDVGWLSGRWLSETAGEWTEENWSSAKGGVLVGTGKSGSGERTRSFEFMRIARDGDALVFYGAPAGRPAVAFREMRPARADSCQTVIVFENAAHDYPQRITYARLGDTLTATTSARDGGNMMRWTYRRVPVE